MVFGVNRGFKGLVFFSEQYDNLHSLEVTVLGVYKYRAGFLYILTVCLQLDHQLSLLYILGSSVNTPDNITSD
jgi:hypothetical protein